MKKFYLILFLLVLLLGGCREDELINDSTSGEILPPPESAYNDGNFKAASQFYDQNGYGQVVDILVKDGTLTKVQYREIDINGQQRLQIEGSDFSWEGLAPLNLSSLYSKLYNDLLMNQSVQDINAISGATETVDSFRLLSRGALKAAMENDPNTQLIDTQATYTIKSSVDPKEYQGILVATFTGETLVSLVFDEINLQDGSRRSKSNEMINGQSLEDLYDSFTSLTLKNQTLEPLLNEENPSPERDKYNECLNELALKRVNFNAP